MTTTIGDSPPSFPAVGDFWWDSVGGQLYLWFSDGTSNQWVPAVNQPGAPGPGVGPQGPPGTPGAPGPPGRNSGDPVLPVIPLPDCDPFACKFGLEALYDQVQLQMPGVTTDNVVLQTWNAISDFYVGSTYRREHIYWRMNPGVNTLSFDPWDSHWRVFRFLGFRGLSRVKFEPPGRIRDLSWPIPDTTRNGETYVALRPECHTTQLGDDFWAMWSNTIEAGVLGRLYLQPGKPYTDAAMGRVQYQLFSKGVAQARAHAQAMFVTDGVPWRYPYFAYGRSKSSSWGGPG